MWFISEFYSCHHHTPIALDRIATGIRSYMNIQSTSIFESEKSKNNKTERSSKKNTHNFDTELATTTTITNVNCP